MGFFRFDKLIDLDNGHRPAGLIRMSETTIDNVQYIQGSKITTFVTCVDLIYTHIWLAYRSWLCLRYGKRNPSFDHVSGQ